MFILCFASWTVNVNTMFVAKLFLDGYLDYKFWGTAVLFSTIALWSNELKLLFTEIVWKNDKKLFYSYTKPFKKVCLERILGFWWKSWNVRHLRDSVKCTQTNIWVQLCCAHAKDRIEVLQWRNREFPYLPSAVELTLNQG